MEVLLEIACIVAGLICVILGTAHSLLWLVIIGLVLLAIGGVWLIFIDDDNGIDLHNLL